MGQLRNPHPGEILKEEFLNEIGISQNKLAEAIGVPGNRIHAIVNGTRDITADTDLRLCKFFGLSEGYFLRLQNALRHAGGQAADSAESREDQALQAAEGRLSHESDHPRPGIDQGAGRGPLHRGPAPAARRLLRPQGAGRDPHLRAGRVLDPGRAQGVQQPCWTSPGHRARRSPSSPMRSIASSAASRSRSRSTS